MLNAIQDYVTYLREVRQISYNTEISYERDLRKAAEYFDGQGILRPEDVTVTALNSYLLALERENMAPATVSRNIASMRSFFQYLQRNHVIEEDPSESLRPPKVEKKKTELLTIDEVRRLLQETNPSTDKGMRDRVMISMLYCTGIRISEMIHLKVGNVNLSMGYIRCTDGRKERMLPVDVDMCRLLELYMGEPRTRMLKGQNSEYLFCNCSGTPMSRQGFWKVIKSYADMAGIDKDVTPRIMHDSFEAHMIRNDGDVHQIHQQLGHMEMVPQSASSMQYS